MYKGILLDIDNTLYDYEPVHQLAMELVYSEVVEKYQISKDEVKMHFARARSEIHLELAESASSHNRLLYFQRMLEIIEGDSLVDGLKLYNGYWDNFLKNLALRSDAKEFLCQVKQKTSIESICLVTDLTAHIQHRKILALNLDQYANCVVTSEEAGREKPHPYMFLLALQKLNMSVNDVVMIGDSFNKDIKGASRLGIRSFWLSREEKSSKASPVKNLKDKVSNMTEVKSLNEVIDYL